MVGELHHRKIALGHAGQQIGPSGDPQIGAADPDQNWVVGEGMHQGSRNELAGQEKQDGNQPAETKHEVKKLLDGPAVAFPEILCAEDGACRRTGHEEHVLYKLDLGCQRHRRHLFLRNAPQHQSIKGRHHGQHQALERDGQRKSPEPLIEHSVVDGSTCHCLHPSLIKIVL